MALIITAVVTAVVKILFFNQQQEWKEKTKNLIFTIPFF